jgi:ribosomal RNA methyltransferase Nop2
MAGKKSRSLSPKRQEKNTRAPSTDPKAKRGAPAKKFTKDKAPVIYKGPTSKVKRNSKERNVLSSLSKEIAAKEVKGAVREEEIIEEEASSEEEEERIVDMTENKQESSKKANIAKKTNKTKPSKKEIKPTSAKEEESEDESNEDEAPKSKKTSKTAQASDSDAESGDDNEGSDDDDAEGKPKKGKFFSDDNAGWLKPKQGKSQLLSSDDEDEDEDGAGDDDEMIGGDDDSDEEMEVERQSRLLDAEMQVEAEEGEEEFRETVSKHTAIYHLPTVEELEGDHDRVVPPSELKSHIESILGVLAEFKERREEGRARTEYIERLAGFMAELFGYLPELMSYFLTMFSPAEALEFVDYSDKPRPMVVRTNTLKTRRKDLALALMKRGVSLDPLANWSKVGLKIVESPVPVGATPEYLSGHYMLQSAASMCPVLALAPEPKERVLDMSAAPGGKTSYIAQLMRNTGVVFANDLRPDRQKATVANMHRLGVKNVVTCMDDGRKLPQIFKHYKFDRILLDAPCSGLGVISRDPSVKVQRTLADVNKCAHLQKELILAAIDCLNHKSKTGGVMVYSTCSVSVAENEEVVNYALQKRDIKIIDTGLDFGRCNNSDM